MQVIGSFTLVPVNAGLSLSPYIAACQKIMAESSLEYELHANGTNVSGDWQAVFDCIRNCHETVHGMGADRIFTTIQIGTRTDRTQIMSDKTTSVKDKLKLS